MEEKLMPRIDLTGYCKDKYILDLDNYEIKEENGVTYMIRKKPQYPKTYEECCKVIDYNLSGTTIIGYKADIFRNFQKLIICRDTYWQIAGAEMGLGKPWMPEWNDNLKYCIIIDRGIISKRNLCNTQFTLAFPTKEICNTFFENFKKLIENCKELL